MNDAVALIELNSIARGHQVADTMVKKAPVHLVEMGVVSPGKYLILVSGDVAAVEESFIAGLEIGAEWIVDHLFLPQPHPQLVGALEHSLPPPTLDAMGLIETFSAVSTLRAADVSLKAASVCLVELRYERHLGGKGYFLVSGELSDIEAALDAAVVCLASDGLLLAREIIPRPHGDLVRRLTEPSPLLRSR